MESRFHIFISKPNINILSLLTPEYSALLLALSYCMFYHINILSSDLACIVDSFTLHNTCYHV